MRTIAVSLVALALSVTMFAQQSDTTKTPEAPRAREKKRPETPAAPNSETKPPESQPGSPEAKSEPKPEPGKEGASEEHYDMTEIPPVVTHHQTTVDGKVLRYTATTGRLPIKRSDGKIEAEMFFVAYTLDGQEAAKRPLTFCFNGGPGSATVWLHMGAVGPKRVVLEANGFMPPPPYTIADNPNTLLDRSDLVFVDAISTGFSRAANAEATKKFLGVKGDIEAFGEFVRLYVTRYERWPSPLFILGESYGTTRAAGIAGFLANRGISFNGITLLSTAMDFGTLEWAKNNDIPYFLLVPTFSMIAAYHKRLPPDLMQDLGKTREEVERWSMNDYAAALLKGDRLAPEERQKIIDAYARYTGLDKKLIDNANLRINVEQFTHNLLLDQKLRVGRLDGRFTGVDPEGLLDQRFYDPTSAAILPPYTAVFNNYVRTELGYKVDLPYKVFAWDEPAFQKWDWGEADKGFPNTAPGLRAALVENPYLKVLVMEGHYDLATPYFAANYSIDHLNLGPDYRKNVSFTTYEAGHMVYIDNASHAKMKKDLVEFMGKSMR
ncbi:MAG TPA: peptidase S10 [Terriglobales bacterium]|nr:peptidase S10 [Terriglobales bacterium]